MTATVRQRPRYKRVPGRKMELTTRDVKMLDHIGRHRFLTAQHVAALVEAPFSAEGRAQGVERRLLLMFDNGYVDRHSLSQPGDQRPFVYKLTKKGRRLLLEHDGPRHIVGETTLPHREHTLLVNDIHVAARASARRHATVFLSLDDIARNYATHKLPQPVGWQVPFRYEGKNYTLPVYPDDVFAVAGKRAPSLLFIEADRGTEPLTRKDLRHRSSIKKKLLLYFELWKQWSDSPAPPLGFKNPRAAFVVSAPEARTRIANMQALGQELGLTPGLFLFATHDELLEGDFLTHPWENLTKKEVLLFTAG